MKHRENNEIDDHDLGPYIADSVRLAEEIGRQDSSAVRMLENDEDDDYDFPPGGLKSEENELEVRPDNGLDYEEQEQQTREPSDEDKNGDLIVEEEEKIASQLQSNANLTGNTLLYLNLTIVVLYNRQLSYALNSFIEI